MMTPVRATIRIRRAVRHRPESSGRRSSALELRKQVIISIVGNGWISTQALTGAGDRGFAGACRWGIATHDSSQVQHMQALRTGTDLAKRVVSEPSPVFTTAKSLGGGG